MSFEAFPQQDMWLLNKHLTKKLLIIVGRSSSGLPWLLPDVLRSPFRKIRGLSREQFGNPLCCMYVLEHFWRKKYVFYSSVFIVIRN